MLVSYFEFLSADTGCIHVEVSAPPTHRVAERGKRFVRCEKVVLIKGYRMHVVPVEGLDPFFVGLNQSHHVPLRMRIGLARS